jgi:Arc/MetJ-type ribon-helix-helix transcriptional regulator
MVGKDKEQLMSFIKRKLGDAGIELEGLADEICCVGQDDVKVLCAVGGIGGSLVRLGETSRDQVVMVRVDEDTIHKLDAWTETGALKSRSEAAALFIREGLELRSGELEQLEAAIDDVKLAKDRLKEKAKEILGGDKENE